MELIRNNRLAASVAVGLAAMYFFNRARENYYKVSRIEKVAQRRLRRLEEGMTSMVRANGFVPVSKPVVDQFPISRFNPPRIQGRKV